LIIYKIGCLDERNVPRDAIKFLLGHSTEKDNLAPYLRNQKKHLNRLRHELETLEQEIEEGVKALKEKTTPKPSDECTRVSEFGNRMESEPKKMSRQAFSKLLRFDEEYALSLIENNQILLETS
jgi:hypothetical protein